VFGVHASACSAGADSPAAAVGRFIYIASAPRTDGRIELVSSVSPKAEMFWLTELKRNPARGRCRAGVARRRPPPVRPIPVPEPRKRPRLPEEQLRGTGSARGTGAATSGLPRRAYDRRRCQCRDHQSCRVSPSRKFHGTVARQFEERTGRKIKPLVCQVVDGADQFGDKFGIGEARPDERNLLSFRQGQSSWARCRSSNETENA